MRVAAAALPAIATIRLGFAGWAAAAPGSLAKSVGVPEKDREAARPYVYALAVREVALAAGCLAAWRLQRGRAGWVMVSAGVDAFDSVVFELLRQLQLLESEPAERARNSTAATATTQALLSLAVPD